MANQADLDNAIAALTAEVTKLAGDINAALARLAQGADLSAEVANIQAATTALQAIDAQAAPPAAAEPTPPPAA